MQGFSACGWPVASGYADWMIKDLIEMSSTAQRWLQAKAAPSDAHQVVCFGQMLIAIQDLAAANSSSSEWKLPCNFLMGL